MDKKSQGKLATFRVQNHHQEWLDFQELCKKNGSTAAKELIGYIQFCVKSGKVGAVGQAESVSSGVTLEDVDMAIAPLRDELTEMRELLGKSQAA